MQRYVSAAKLNLALHVQGRRPEDGYHLLDSLVVSADFGAQNDQLGLYAQPEWKLQVSGPASANVPDDARNLVLKAAHHFSTLPPQHIYLHKALPHGAGLGAGSMNAATLLCALLPPAQHADAELAKLGADIPACMALQRNGWLRMQGIGEQIQPLAACVPDGLYAVVTHPGEGLSTPAVYAEVTTKDYALNMPETLPQCANAQEFAQWLRTHTTNSLQPAAHRLTGMIAQQILALEAQASCLLARMSGSGSACFGLFARAEDAEHAASSIRNQQPHWWVEACALGVPVAMVKAESLSERMSHE